MRENSGFAAWLERMRTVPGLGRDAGALAAMIVLGLVATVIIKAQLGGSVPWADTTTVRAEVAEVPGLNPDSQNSVTIAGVKVGSVTQTEATDRGTALVTMVLDGDYSVHRDARVVLRPKNALNEMQVELNPGTSKAGALGEATIPVDQTSRPVQADEVLSHLDERSQVALTDLLLESDTALARAPEALPEGLDATSDTLRTLRPVVAELQDRREKIADLVSALSTISTAVGENDERITRLATATSGTLSTLAASDDQLRSSLRTLPGFTDELRNALRSTQDLTGQLDPTLDGLHAASAELPRSLKRFRSTVGNLDRTVRAAQPALDKAVPVVSDLRPLVGDVRTSLAPLTRIGSRLDGDTRTVMTYLTALKAFVYNTSSVFGAGDTNGSIIRGHLMVPLPGAAVLPNSLTQGRGDQ
ncbi:MlaD family protein [Nocardioides daeguensis]|uniref:Mce/MlaD domain-containing protein n=1 Tax=Nocardioides daeguensis TaxID=908359 RepID=A0ABP6UZB4_9ACTN|nr:MlaD family protein [Nocardioides daeguensis]MBV6728785.1 MCE family protein [Nocardioides daeguensis]MCR1773605.1 MCE family protein [Nocardioides daeguensis]